jgi:hypothetical protein
VDGEPVEPASIMSAYCTRWEEGVERDRAVRGFGAVWLVENVLAVVVVVDGSLVAGLVLEWSLSWYLETIG